MGYRIVNFQLSEEDEAILKGVSEALYTTKVNVIRWALRWYALRGPWTTPQNKKRQEALGDITEMDLGPTVKGGE